MTLKFRSTDGGSNLTQKVTLGAGGAFSVSNIPSGTYSLAIKGNKGLQAAVPIDINAGSISSVRAYLNGGDANNDNSVDSTDFGLLIGAYNSDASIPGSGYDVHADFKDDGFIDSADFGILIGNYGLIGAN